MGGADLVARDAIVVGAGIIGVSVAAYLSEAGLNVTVFDRTGICEETSSGNQAALAFSDILPLATKGMLASVPGWLADPEGPLRIPIGYLPTIAPWLLRFWREGWADRRARSIAAQTALMKLAEPEILGLLNRAGAAELVRHDGAIQLYESERELQVSRPSWRLREEAGIPVEEVRDARLAELQPGLSPRFIAGIFTPSWKTVTDPREVGHAIWNHAERLGARFVKGTVEQVVPTERAVVARADGWPETVGDVLVVTAGAWSSSFTSELGDKIPLETERGYNTTFPASAFDLRRQLVFGGHGFVATPLGNGIRIGGSVEFGGLDRAPDYRRAEMMVEKAKRFLPGLNTEGGREWMGFRPSLPDTLPVIGHSRLSRRVFYAFGHGHLGLTQSAATGRLICNLVLGEPPAIDIARFDPRRF